MKLQQRAMKVRKKIGFSGGPIALRAYPKPRSPSAESETESAQ